MSWQYIVLRENKDPELPGARTLDGSEIKRQFIPSMVPEYGYCFYLPETERPRLLSYDSSKQWWRLQQTLMTGPESWESRVAENTLVLAIANCHMEVPPYFVYSWAVSFGPDSQYNYASGSTERRPQNPIYCTRIAMDHALRTIERILDEQHPVYISSVLIMTHSEKLVDTLAWRREPYSMQDMQTVGFLIPFFHEIDVLWKEIENKFRVSIQLWYKRDWPADVTELARSAWPSIFEQADR